MPRINKFGIWDSDILELVDEIANDPQFNITMHDLISFFYNEGGEEFNRSEILIIHNYSFQYLIAERKFPYYVPNQILGNKFVAFVDMKILFLKHFEKNEEKKLNDCFDAFIVKTIKKNEEFFTIEATVRSGLREFFHASTQKDIGVKEFDEYMYSEYTKVMNSSLDNDLKLKIQDHLQFLREINSIASPRTRQRSLPPVVLLSTIEAIIQSPTGDSESPVTLSSNPKFNLTLFAPVGKVDISADLKSPAIGLQNSLLESKPEAKKKHSICKVS